MHRRREIRDSRWPIFTAGGLIAVAACWTYGGSFSGPFVFDDLTSIAQNATIRHLWPIWPVLNPPADGGLTVGGRPMVNLSLAVNYALGGERVWGYHAVNLGIHVLAGLTLFGVVRRTLHSIFLGFAVALLWVLHPLQTESVTYLAQRAESLMGLFYLLTLYCFIRGVERVVPNALVRPAIVAPDALGTTRSTVVGGDPLWFSLSFLACSFGMWPPRK